MVASARAKSGFDPEAARKTKANVVPISRAYARDESENSTSEYISPAMQDQILIDELYPAPEIASPELVRALALLSEAAELLRAAGEMLQDGDRIGSDGAAQRVQALLPELFNCRKLGDGFGATINAVQCAIENLSGVPLDNAQIRAVSRALAAVRSEPFLSFDAACELAVHLEETGLAIEPVGYGHLADWLDGESVR